MRFLNLYMNVTDRARSLHWGNNGRVLFILDTYCILSTQIWEKKTRTGPCNIPHYYMAVPQGLGTIWKLQSHEFDWLKSILKAAYIFPSSLASSPASRPVMFCGTVIFHEQLHLIPV